MSDEILFYDLTIQSSVRANKCFAPNTLCVWTYRDGWNPRLTHIPSPVRYALNYKKLPYKTVWLEVQEIEPVAKKFGAKPTKVKPNGYASSFDLYDLAG